MAYSDQVTYDNLSLQAITVPAGVFAKQVTLRELASVSTPQSYSISVPGQLNGVFSKLPLETTVLPCTGPGNTIGYIQTGTGSTTFTRLFE